MVLRLELEEYAGQKKDVIITKRDDGSIYFTFKTESGYGNPSLNEDEMEELLEKAKNMKKV